MYICWFIQQMYTEYLLHSTAQALSRYKGELSIDSPLNSLFI